jgi:hypothetical protein
VLNTIQFGNSGTDYTGTYVEAAAADVEYGVTFGPSSSYTGTFVGGGFGKRGILTGGGL